MSSPWTSKTKPAEAAEPFSPTDAVVPEQRKYNRHPGPEFGNRLANARNLHHTHAPPPLPRRLLPGLGTQPAMGTPRPETICFGDMSPINTTEPPKKEPIFTMPETKAAQPPPHVQERLILLGPLRMIRRQCANTPGLDLLVKFIDKHMADGLQTVIEQDPIIPGVVYMVSLPMTEEHWQMYNQILSRCGHALGVHEMLATGKDGFDHWSGSASPHLTPEQREAYRVLVSGASAGLDLEEFMAELVKDQRWMWIMADSGYAGEMER
ncbi:uncharacterized protein K460DRAFT_430504 [Cucurbitaria berberidis CBS 394.84]|uniref:Uncharacterized protein n=1 Tax=Cucurbitaria berberidis CBS 394.84 TaxID=1168544 RepID=A0A9P4L8Q2_9PLEO|nr:uncharacterized protein K460DRAFT_430504 [Cucurbitaria berberidis CBS 394.84]KAF1845587.1 hypothetical protein K460DRAFT_430504 [Cucurbitaria berberidis CBS 394.84]